MLLDRCQHADDLEQLKVLKKLVIDHDLLPPSHLEKGCQIHHFGRFQLLTGSQGKSPVPVKSPAEILLSLPSSLRELELRGCKETLITSTLLKFMQCMLSDGRLPNLYCLEVEFKRPLVASRGRARIEGRTCTHALRVAAATIPRLRLEVEVY